MNNPFGGVHIDRTAQKYPEIESPQQNQNGNQFQMGQQSIQQYIPSQQQFQSPMPMQQNYLTPQFTAQAPNQYQQQYQQPPQQQQPQQYGQQQPNPYQAQQFQQFQSPPPQINDFDPYHSLSTLHSNQMQPPPSSSNFSNQNQNQNNFGGNQQSLHPRQFVEMNKPALTSFDRNSWLELLKLVDGVLGSWENRKRELDSLRGNPSADPVTLAQLILTANENIDSTHASKLQISEVQSGYQHSTDTASKVRVREALNAGLRNLPEFPAPLPPTQSQQFSMKKEGILAGYNQQPLYQQQQPSYQQQQPQQQFQQYPSQQSPYLQAQPTGYGQQQQQQPQGGYGGMMQPQQTGYPQQQPFNGNQPYPNNGQYYQ